MNVYIRVIGVLHTTVELTSQNLESSVDFGKMLESSPQITNGSESLNITTAKWSVTGYIQCVIITITGSGNASIVTFLSVVCIIYILNLSS